MPVALRIAFSIALTVGHLDVHSALRIVPQDYPTIQEAVNATAAQDTVLLLTGEYSESVNIHCRSMTIAGEFVLSGDTSDIRECRWIAPAGLRHIHSLDCASYTSLAVRGISFSGSQSGGGLEIDRHLVRLSDCEFDSCSATLGGALRVSHSDLTIERCSFKHVRSLSGAVAYLDSVRCTILRSSIFNSEIATSDGALIRLGGRSTQLSEVTIAHCNLLQERNLFDLTGTIDTFALLSCTIDSNVFAHAFSQSNGLCNVLTVRGSEFIANTIRRSIFLDALMEVGTLSVSECIFSRNTADNFVGVSAMFTCQGHYADCQLNSNLFSENSWFDESCLNVYFLGIEQIKHNYFIGNSSLPLIFTPCVIFGNGNVASSFEQNIFQGNLISAFEGPGAPPAARALNNYWGDVTGPFNSDSNPQGLGDTVGNYVDFIPWAEDTLFLNAAHDFNNQISFALGYPYPNPFNSSVTIEYALTREQDVTLDIYDVLGRQVESILNERQVVGLHSVLWNADEFASGLYFARLSSDGGASQGVKLMLLK